MLFYAPLGSIVLEVEEEIDGAVTVGTTGSDAFTVGGVNIPLSEAAEVWKKPLEKVFPTKAGHFTSEPETFSYDKRNITVATEKFANREYLFLYSRVQTANTILQEHLKTQVLWQMYLL